MLDLQLDVDIDVSTVHADLKDIDAKEIDPEIVEPQLESDIPTLLDGYETWLLSEGNTEGTASSYGLAAKHYFWILAHHDDTLTEIDPTRLKEYLKVMATPEIASEGDGAGLEPYGDSTIRGRYAGIKCLYDFLRDRASGDDIPNNPGEQITLDFLDKTSKKEEALNDQGFYAITPKQKDELVDNVPAPALKNEILVRLTYQTGCRKSELMQLRVDDIEHPVSIPNAGGVVHVPAVKTDEPRSLPYDPKLNRLLDRYLDGYREGLPGVGPKNDWLFPSGEGDNEHMTGGHANDVVVKAARRSGLRRETYVDKQGNQRTVPTIHTLRHSYAVQSMKNGMNLRDLQKALGHADIRNTLKYLKALTRGRMERLAKHGAGPTNDEAVIARTEPDIDPEVFLTQ